MRAETVNRILNTGSSKERIRLYFTDIAIFSVYLFSGDIDKAEEEEPLSLLTQAQRDEIFNSITERKDIAYYKELRNYNKAFLLFKPTVNNIANNFKYIKSEISKYTVYTGLSIAYEDLINEMLDNVNDDNTKATLLDIALKSLSPVQAKHVKHNSRSLIEFTEDSIPETLYSLIQTLNNSTKDAKEFIEGIKLFLNKYLPLQPYKQYIKEHETKIKGYILECKAMLQLYTNIQNTETILKRLTVDKNPKKQYKYIVNNWEDIEVEVTDEDIEDIKTAGL